MLRAARKPGTHAAMVIQGGCRGCQMRGLWPGKAESTAHAVHDCRGPDIRDIVRWKGDVIKRMKRLIDYTRKIGHAARTLTGWAEGALRAMCMREPRGRVYMDLRGIVGGTIPWWDSEEEEMDAKHNKHIVMHLTHIQSLFSERLGEWTAIMAPAGWQRQPVGDGISGVGRNLCCGCCSIMRDIGRHARTGCGV